jgi:hypothetical protein
MQTETTITLLTCRHSALTVIVSRPISTTTIQTSIKNKKEAPVPVKGQGP